MDIQIHETQRCPKILVLKSSTPKQNIIKLSKFIHQLWNSNTIATWCKELTHLKRPWCWERLRAGGEGHDRGWDGWMASTTQWTWVWVNFASCWWTGRPGVLWFMGSQRVRCDWATELNWNWISVNTAHEQNEA